MTFRKALPNGNKSQGGFNSRTHVNEQVETLLKDMKNKAGAMILVPITSRTSIELPASLSKEEIEARVANYKKLHTSKI